MRRKKGHQDGRIVLRYVAQAVREGSCEIMFEKVLSWLVGHLDASNVTGEHMEIFFHFLQQGAHRELPAAAHPYVDAAFEEMIAFVRQASSSGTISALIAVSRNMPLNGSWISCPTSRASTA